jgi:hypothetical protein
LIDLLLLFRPLVNGPETRTLTRKPFVSHPDKLLGVSMRANRRMKRSQLLGGGQLKQGFALFTPPLTYMAG